ncbi:MAG: HupE/UreJ family protein [Janthinobacterium lividum]
MKFRHSLLLAAVAALTVSDPAWAHTEVSVPGGLLSGFMHPLSGLDHLVAMVSVGLWGAMLGAPAIWVLPIAFPLVMAFGAVLGVVGVPVPPPELMIALSAVVLGLAVAFAARAPLWIAAIIVSVFAIFHGYAHGQELPEISNALAYGVGFVVATGLLHACGISAGLLTKYRSGGYAVRLARVGVAVLGLVFLREALA